MQTGTKISGIAHVALIGWLLFGGSFTSRPLPAQVTDVALISAEEYAAMTTARPAPEAAETPESTAVPEPSMAPAPEVELTNDAPPEQAAPEQALDPEPAPVPDPTPEPPAPDAEVRDTPPVMEQQQDQIVALPDPVSPRPVPRPIDRVAPTPVAPPPPDATPDQVAQPEVTADEGAETPQEAQEETAPEEAADQIVPETAEPPRSAPAKSPRPPSRRPTKPEAVAEKEPTAPAETPTAPAETPVETPLQTDNTADAIDDVLAEALADAPAAPAAPSGPPLSAGEREALRVAVSACWNVGSLSSDALATTVVVGVKLARDGRPDAGSIRLLSHSGGTAGSAQDAFGAARRAIIRCGAPGFNLPVEKYDQWRDIEMTFNPERMRIK
ncbi:energy transducer TonB [Pontibaca salina]|uniref:Energy transducer TonB n=1 Tax=Pontibaca salina TaxID=2795731 RepID=A0A934HS44_9RHOB|nr:energy transducer TonB [Pontibaca salina]MBI6628614.1 energy transducer TonB [Pontibaca salina]